MFRFGDPGGRIYTSVGTSNANLLAHWTSTIGGTWTVSAGNGRTTGSCLRVVLSGPSTLSKTLDARATWGIAFAFRLSSLGTNNNSIVSFIDASNVQVDLRQNSDGTLSVTRNGTVLATTATAALSINTWTHIELKVTIDPSAGTVSLYINSVLAINLTGQNTRATANSTANVVALGTTTSPAVGSNWDYDDVIVYDSQSTDANGFTDIVGPIGDCGLVWLLPTGAGTTTQWTPDSGSNYARVNEATPDGDTSAVDDGTVGHIDTYAMADLAGTATAVKSMAAVHYAKKTDVSSRGMKSELRSAGANAAHATEIALGNSYQYFFSSWGQNPNNGSPTNWTTSSVNALEAGQNVSS